MKSYYKWSAVGLLCIMLCVIALSFSSPAPDPLPGLEETLAPPSVDETISSGTESEEDSSTLFPKLPVLSPFSETGYIQSVSGSGEERAKAIWQDGEFTVLIGETTSSDYDFHKADGKVFLSYLDDLGRLLSAVTLPSSTKYISSCLCGEGVVVFCRASELYSLYLVSSGKICSSAPFGATGGKLLAGNSSFYLLDGGASSLHEYDYSLNRLNTLALPSSFTPIDLSILGDTITVLGNTDNDAVSYFIKSDMSGFSQLKLSGERVISCVPALFSGELGYACIKESEGELTLFGASQSGEAWSVPLGKGADGRVLRSPSGRYLVFLKQENGITSSIYCSHGDLIKSSLALLDGLFPIEYTYSDSSLVILATDINEKSGSLLAVNGEDDPSLIAFFDNIRPSSLCLSDNSVAICATCSDYSAPFFGGLGKSSAFVIGLSR